MIFVMSFIQIRGARQHNLCGVDIDIPKGKMTVITGPSGCGKSSLAFHTLYAEGQRRYLECLGVNAHKVVKGLEKPDFDYIEGLNPTVALQQDEVRVAKGVTVAMMTEVHDYLRLLYATVGIPHDPKTGQALEKLTSGEIVTRLSTYPERTKLILLAPLDVSLISNFEFLKDDLRRQGFVRVAIGSDLYDIDDEWPKGDELSVVVDRLMVRDGAESRIADSLEIALQINDSGAKALIQKPESDSWEELSFTTSFHNPETGFVLSRLDASCFSYASKFAQCPDCEGSGRVEDKLCKSCQGGRLSKEYLSVKLVLGEQKLGIAELTQQSVEKVSELLQELMYPEVLKSVIEEVLAPLGKRLRFLKEVGLDYLSLAHWGVELSTGEYQRLRLASQLGGGLSGVLYILDEPSRGLHKKDTGRLINALYELRDSGNTVIIVEHDPNLILASDWMIDMGPGAGELGGLILAEGEPKRLINDENSPTGKWLAELSKNTKLPSLFDGVGDKVSIKNATLHNLDGFSADFKVGAMTALTGPSGSGKSSLVMQTLAPYAQFKLHRAAPFIPQAEIEGIQNFSRVVSIDQSSLGRSPRSSPATYTGLFDVIRSLFASLPLSKQRGYNASRFSFNVKGGRCEKCLGSGKIRVPLQFLNDGYVTCDACEGQRYNNETLEVRYKGKSISEVLNGSISQSLELFRNNPKLAPGLESLESVGLGYLRLGQGANTLSGGEAQRVKIATELMKANPDKRRVNESTLYLLDEPTRGLHFMDVEVLVQALRSLLIGRNTVIVIEHHEQFVSHCDFQVEMTPFKRLL